ncbi:MAG: hypothetical protein ABIJ22_00185 [Patescibacteria group bacterium]
MDDESTVTQAEGAYNYVMHEKGDATLDQITTGIGFLKNIFPNPKSAELIEAIARGAAEAASDKFSPDNPNARVEFGEAFESWIKGFVEGLKFNLSDSSFQKIKDIDVSKVDGGSFGRDFVKNMKERFKHQSLDYRSGLFTGITLKNLIAEKVYADNLLIFGVGLTGVDTKLVIGNVAKVIDSIDWSKDEDKNKKSAINYSLNLMREVGQPQGLEQLPEKERVDLW